MHDKNKINAGRAVAAGVVAGGAYLGAMWVDNRVSSHQFNDLKLVGQTFTTKSPWWVIQGLVGHFGFSAVMALVYARFAYRHLPGPDVLRAVVFMNIENTSLYSAAFLLDKFHAGIRNSNLPPLLNKKTFWGQVVRHIAFGVALGLLYKPDKALEPIRKIYNSTW